MLYHEVDWPRLARRRNITVLRTEVAQKLPLPHLASAVHPTNRVRCVTISMLDSIPHCGHENLNSFFGLDTMLQSVHLCG